MRKKFMPTEGRSPRRGTTPYDVISTKGEYFDENMSWVQRLLKAGDLVEVAETAPRAKKDK